MKKISLLLATLSLLSVCLCACGDAASEQTDTAAETQAPVTEEAVLNIVENGESAFSVGYAEDAADEVAASAQFLALAVRSFTGAELPVVVSASAFASCIYLEVGEKTPSDTELDTLDYAVYRDDTGGVVIRGGSAQGVSLGTDAFIKKYVGKEGVAVPETINTVVPYERIDNSALIPEYREDSEVELESSPKISTSPDWLKTAVMVELRIETATSKGTFEAALPLLDHYAQMGVNVIWITPIYEKGPGGNGYGNCGPHTLDLSMTGTKTVEEGWAVVKSFIDAAHSKNIRILLDIITWGAMRGSELYAQHPEYFSGEAWGNPAYNWRNKDFVEWFKTVAVDNIVKSGADGYRCDCEPNFAGYAVFSDIRQRLLDLGIKTAILAEDGNERREAFDAEMDGVLLYSQLSRGQQYQKPVQFYLDSLNIVDSVKTGEGIGSENLQHRKTGGRFRYYTYCVTNHDYQHRVVNKNRLIIGYQAIYAPFIPYWYMGDERGVTMDKAAVLFDVRVNMLSRLNSEDELFFEDVKQMIKIRRTYPEIFEYFPSDHRNSNICKVETQGLTKLQAYARYANNRGIMVIPNNERNNDGWFSALIPYEEMGMGEGVYRLTDLLGSQVIREGSAQELSSFEGMVRYEHMGVYMIEKIG